MTRNRGAAEAPLSFGRGARLVNFTFDRTRVQQLRFRLVEDQLQLWVNEGLVISAHDDDIAEGHFGLATNRAAATWHRFFVKQP